MTCLDSRFFGNQFHVPTRKFFLKVLIRFNSLREMNRNGAQRSVLHGFICFLLVIPTPLARQPAKASQSVQAQYLRTAPRSMQIDCIRDLRPLGRGQYVTDRELLYKTVGSGPIKVVANDGMSYDSADFPST